MALSLSWCRTQLSRVENLSIPSENAPQMFAVLFTRKCISCRLQSTRMDPNAQHQCFSLWIWVAWHLSQAMALSGQHYFTSATFPRPDYHIWRWGIYCRLGIQRTFGSWDYFASWRMELGWWPNSCCHYRVYRFRAFYLSLQCCQTSVWKASYWWSIADSPNRNFGIVCICRSGKTILISDVTTSNNDLPPILHQCRDCKVMERQVGVFSGHLELVRDVSDWGCYSCIGFVLCQGEIYLAFRHQRQGKSISILGYRHPCGLVQPGDVRAVLGRFHCYRQASQSHTLQSPYRQYQRYAEAVHIKHCVLPNSLFHRNPFLQSTWCLALLIGHRFLLVIWQIIHHFAADYLWWRLQFREGARITPWLCFHLHLYLRFSDDVMQYFHGTSHPMLQRRRASERPSDGRRGSWTFYVTILYRATGKYLQVSPWSVYKARHTKEREQAERSFCGLHQLEQNAHWDYDLCSRWNSVAIGEYGQNGVRRGPSINPGFEMGYMDFRLYPRMLYYRWRHLECTK